MKAKCCWLISNGSTHLAYTYSHWLIWNNTDPIVKLLKMKANCYWLISNYPTHLAYTHCHWLIWNNTDPIVKLLKMKANCYWLISNDSTHLAYTHCHWLISIRTDSIVNILMTKANCYWLISNGPTHLPYTNSHWLISINVHPIVNLKGLTLCEGHNLFTYTGCIVVKAISKWGQSSGCPYVTWLIWQVAKIGHVTWHSAKFWPCDLALCQFIWRHLAPSQLPLLDPSPQADFISLKISTNAPSHAKRYPIILTGEYVSRPTRESIPLSAYCPRISLCGTSGSPASRAPSSPLFRSKNHSVNLG